MRSSTLYTLFLFLIYPTLITLPALYLYPLLTGCRFPEPDQPQAACLFEKDASQPLVQLEKVAPFRLLIFADPQLEGDSSLPDPDDPIFPSFQKFEDLNNGLSSTAWKACIQTVKDIIIELFSSDLPRIFSAWRKRLDLLGNDFYLAHIYRATHWWLSPTHVTVLGDLLGSQWVSDEEFERRGQRYWRRVFREAQRVEEHLARNDVTETIGEDARWQRRILNVAGNHDVGYAGDMTRHRLDRFERVFGRANYEIRFQLPSDGSNSSTLSTDVSALAPRRLRVVVLNSMNMDAPALDTDMQSDTYRFINEDVIGRSDPVEDRQSATIVLTHIPLHKDEGVCVDSPSFAYHESGHIREQNHLSQGASRNILEGIIGMNANTGMPNRGRGRKSIILTGHDHEGCRVYHYLPKDADPEDNDRWKAVHHSLAGPLIHDDDVIGAEEITLRSMMGSYGGNTGLLSAWYDDQAGEWQFRFDTCPFVVQHVWWGVHVLTIVTVLVGLSGVALEARELWHQRHRIEPQVTVAKENQETGNNLKMSTSSRESGSQKRRRAQANGRPPDRQKIKA